MKNQRTRKGDGLLFCLLLLMALTLPWSLNAARWAPQGYRLATPAVVAAIVGALLARSPLPIWLAWGFGAVFGAEYTLQFVGSVIPRLELLWRDLRSLAAWLLDVAFLRYPEPIAPFSRSLTHVNSQIGELLGNLTQWAQAVQLGETTRDTTFMRLALTYLVWLLVMHAALELFRTRRTFLAILPLGVGLISNVAYTSIGIGYVYLYFGVALLTMVWAHTTHLEGIWERRGIDIAAHLRSGAMYTGTLVSAAIIVIALMTPYVTLDRAINHFWSVYGPEIERFYERLDKAFAGRHPVPTPERRPGDEVGQHLVYTAPRLDQTEIFRVVTSDPPPVSRPDYGMDPWAYEYEPQWVEVPKRYWRQRTYDAYTGRGWENPEQQTTDWAANTEWKEPPDTDATMVLTQRYTLVQDTGSLAYHVNEPITLDHPYAAITRGSGDLIALTVDADVYTVISLVPNVTEEQLQAAEGEYPPQIRERYLSTENVPESVQALAQRIVAEVGAVTRYEKARAIEAYLRQFEYNLEIEAPPPGADIVEHLLFEVGQGYCDYMASAMVVMLRSVGVASRYASGFNMGYYDEMRAAWIVQETNAHAWPEVYFPDIGWVEFEPTPSQTVFDFPASASGEERLQLPPPPPVPTPEPAAEEPTLPALWGVTVLIITLVVFLVLRPPARLRRRRRAPAQVVWGAYSGLLRRAGWLGIAPRGGQTPSEYLHALRTELRRRGMSLPNLEQDLEIIGRAYQRLRYSQAPISEGESEAVERAYQRLRMPMLRLMFARVGSSARSG